MDDLYLPPEIIDIILGFVNDTKTYCDCRLVCKRWYNQMRVGKIFKYNMLFRTLVFKPNLIEFLDTNNQVVGTAVFKPYGNYVYKDKNNLIIAKPFMLKKQKTEFSCIEHIKYDIINDEKVTRYITLPGCVIS